MDVVLFGPPGAGKGTQATLIVDALGIPHVSTGDIFRKHLQAGTQAGQLARSFIDRGELVPDSVVVGIVATRLEEPDAMGGALFDGFPRTVHQAELLDAWLAEHERTVDFAINLAVDDELIVARLSGRRTCLGCGATYHKTNNAPRVDGRCDRCDGDVVQREDDAEQTVRARIGIYHRDTAPVLAWLRERYPVIDIQSGLSIEMVGQQIRAAIGR